MRKATVTYIAQAVRISILTFTGRLHTVLLCNVSLDGDEGFPPTVSLELDSHHFFCFAFVAAALVAHLAIEEEAVRPLLVTRQCRFERVPFETSLVICLEPTLQRVEPHP